MTRIELDDQILNHDKFIRVGKRAGGDGIWLWLGLRAYCAQRLSDGFIPDDMLDEVRGPRDPRTRSKCLQILKDERLVEDSEGGVLLHDYLQHSSSREQVEEWRRKARERKAESRRKSPKPSRVTSQRDTTSDDNCDSPSDSDSSHTGVTDTRARGEEEEGGGSSEGVQGKPKRGKTKAPEWLEPTEATRKVAEELGVDFGKHWEDCRDWFWRNGELMADWQATVRGFMRRSPEKHRIPKLNGNGQLKLVDQADNFG